MEGSAAGRRARQQERREQRSAITDPDIVLAASAALLAIRPRTTHELRLRLVALGYPRELVDVTVDRLLALGYLDDEAYARAWVGGRDRSRPRGTAALRQELLRKGLGRELVDAALHEREQGRRAATAGAILDPDDTDPGDGSSADHAAALRLLERRRSALLREPDVRKRRQRAYALLARNGFDPGVCMDVTRAYLQDANEVPSELV
jgi:regulatory protein